MEIKGDLYDVPLDSLIEMIGLQEKTGFLTITRNEDVAVLYFLDGRLCGAVKGDLEGEEVIYNILNWTTGAFIFNERMVSPGENIKREGLSVYKEGLRKLFVFSALRNININLKEEKK